ncbi:hypothetical protein MBT84_19860 [Streptomyces sp. MBT84]|uniref:hypothetical protein n=1 Tax=Streptomyces sp. MBT84 TaxID=1488414 RepID=UPI001C6F1901|nr:hypothetical protein [Streptomyces sp. MBT84]MBW8701866.1 hypothetical protein [Streptomyces sp. MBT84]
MSDHVAGLETPASSPILESSELLASAITVAQRMLSSFGSVGYSDVGALAQAHGALAESLRIVLRSLGAELVDEQEAVRRSVDAQFPVVAAFLADERGDQR